MVLIVIGLIVIGIAVCYGFVKAVNVVFNPWIRKLDAKKTNPYITAHTNRIRNDNYYEEYLKWMDKTNGELPIHKVKTPEERRFDKNIKL